MDPDERLHAHELREPLLAHPQEEDVLTLACMRGQCVELLAAEVGGVHPRGDLLVGQADFGPSPASDGSGSSHSAPNSRMICPNSFIIERGAVVQYTFDAIPVSDSAAIVIRFAWM